MSYDGTDFAGWACQPGQRTVQGTLQDALGTILRVPVALTVAGRTDAGVHATGQVAHADLPTTAWASLEPSLLRRLAGVLPADVRVRTVASAADGFDARFSALARRYAYRLTDAPWGVNPLQRFDTVAWPRKLDHEPMQEAARLLVGEHDFAAYCRRRAGATTIRRLLRLDWEREPSGLLVATVEADAFCHTMVRSLIGALLDVGTGLRPPGWPAVVLSGRTRVAQVNVAPARGLTLQQVRYPAANELAQRAAHTRRRRTCVRRRRVRMTR